MSLGRALIKRMLSIPVSVVWSRLVSCAFAGSVEAIVGVGIFSSRPYRSRSCPGRLRHRWGAWPVKGYHHTEPAPSWPRSWCERSPSVSPVLAVVSTSPCLIALAARVPT
jgi:hypothetical protein